MARCAGRVIRGLMGGVASCHVDAREVFWLGECALGTGLEASPRVCLAPIARTDANRNSPPDVLLHTSLSYGLWQARSVARDRDPMHAIAPTQELQKHLV